MLDAFGSSLACRINLRPLPSSDWAVALKPRGSLFMMNVIVDDDDDAAPDDLVRLLRRQWHRVRLLDTDGWVDRNAVIVAGAVSKLKRPRLLMAPRPGGAKLARELAVLDWRPIRWA